MFERFQSWLTKDRLEEDGGAGGGVGGVGGIANAAGTGAIAGLGVGPKGEPGVDNRGKKTRLEKLAARRGRPLDESHELLLERGRTSKRLTVLCNDPDDSLEELIKHIGYAGRGGHSFSIVVDPGDDRYEKKFFFDGDGSDSIQDVLSQIAEALDVSKDDVEKAAEAVHQQWMDKQKELGHEEHKSPDGKEDYMVPYEDLSKPAKDLDRSAVKAVIAALKTEDYKPSDEKFAGATVFEVDMDRVMGIKGPKHPRHRYSRYVGTDEIGEGIRQHGRKHKGDIVLKDQATAVMTYLRRKAPKA